MPEDPYASYQQPAPDPYAAYQAPALPDSQQRHVGPQAHAMAQEFIAKHPELGKDAQALLDHSTGDGPGVLSGIASFLASPLTSLKNAPAAVMDWFKNGPKPSGGFSSDNPAEQAYGNITAALGPDAVSSAIDAAPETLAKGARATVAGVKAAAPDIAKGTAKAAAGVGTGFVGSATGIPLGPLKYALGYGTARGAMQIAKGLKKGFGAARNVMAEQSVPTLETPPTEVPLSPNVATASNPLPPEVIADLMRESEAPPAAPPNTPGLPPRMAGPATATPEAAAPVNGKPRMQSYVYEPEDVEPTASKQMPAPVNGGLPKPVSPTFMDLLNKFKEEHGIVTEPGEITPEVDYVGLLKKSIEEAKKKKR